MITPNQLRNTARFGTTLDTQTIHQIADRLEQLEHEILELKTKNLQPMWPADVNYVLSAEPIPAITIDDIFPTPRPDNPQDVDFTQINKYDTK